MKPWAEWFYKGMNWLHVQAAYMASQGCLCERCKREGKIVAAKIVHHKIHLTERNIHDPLIAYSWSNLEALCQTCHNREHHRAEKARYRIGVDGELLPPIPPKSRRGSVPRGGD